MELDDATAFEVDAIDLRVCLPMRTYALLFYV
jgi:hypothetical protein